MSFQYIGDELSAFRHATNWKKYWASKVFEVVPMGIEVVEIGSGIGGNFIPLSKYTKNYTGVEPDMELVRISKKENPQISFIQGDIRSLKPSRTPIAVFYIDVLEHIENDKIELENAGRCLNSGSYLVLLVPAHMRLYSKFDQSIGHFRRYSTEELLSIVPPSFECLFVTQLDSLGFLLSFVSKKMGLTSKISKLQVKIWDFLIPISGFIDDKFNLPGKSILLVLKKE